MLEQDYKELMKEVTPGAALVEKMVEAQSKRRKHVVLPKAMKVAAAVLCGIVVLAGGVVAVDAAADGAVRKLFGLDESVVIGAEMVSVSKKHLEEDEWSQVNIRRDENGKMICEISSTTDAPIFAWYFEIGTASYNQFQNTFKRCDTEEDYAWSLYECLSRCFSDRFRKGEFGHEEFLSELERCVEQLDTENAFQRACAQGIQWFMDDLKSEKKTKVLTFPVIDYYDTDGDGDFYEWIGDSYVVVYPEEWKKEYEENGTTEFIVEAEGGMKRTYQITVKDFGSWSLVYRDMSVDYSTVEELGLGE
ncbi:MAG: hypothetical protein IKB07_01505 [Lachnospiraceae bacterium]|nr:hypothetical protein [Lachnospiraceae bacterium]